MSCSVTILQVPGREEGRRKRERVCQRFARQVPFNMQHADCREIFVLLLLHLACIDRYHSDKAVENGGQHTAAAAAEVILPAVITWSMASRPTPYRQWFSIIVREQQLPSTTDFITSEEAHTVHPTTTTCLPKDIK